MRRRLVLIPLALGALLCLGSGTASALVEGQLVPVGCVANAPAPAPCAAGASMVEMGGIAISPDGRHAYAVAGDSGAVAVFDRDRTTGALTQKAGAAGSVATTSGRAPAAIAISPDGASVYVTANASPYGAIETFDRDAATGELVHRSTADGGCWVDDASAGACTQVAGADGVPQQGAWGQLYSVVVSADGADVYATTMTGHAVLQFRRDAATGELTPNDCIMDAAGGPGTGFSCAATAPMLTAPYSIALSPDDSFAYTADYMENGAVTELIRDRTTGRLTVFPLHGGCISNEALGACDVSTNGGGPGETGALANARSIAVTPDGGTVIVATKDQALAVFARDDLTGQLTDRNCFYHLAAMGTRCAEDPGLPVGYVAISPDGRFAYVGGHGSVAAFALDDATGELAPLPGEAGCIGTAAGCSPWAPVDDFAGVGLAFSPGGANLYTAARNGVLALGRAVPVGLGVATAGPGTGAVTSAPAGIDCGATCSGTFLRHDDIALTAAPAAGSAFAGWSGACSGTRATCVVSDYLGSLAVCVTMDAMCVAAPPFVATATARFTIAMRLSGISGAGGMIRATVRAPGAGRLVLRALRVGGARSGRGACVTARDVTAAGVAAIACRPNAATRALLRRGAVRVRVTVSFAESGGGRSQAVRTIALSRVAPPAPVTG